MDSAIRNSGQTCSVSGRLCSEHCLMSAIKPKPHRMRRHGSPGAEATSPGWRLWNLLPHEIFFGFFLMVTWARLTLSLGFFDQNTLLYLVLIFLHLPATQ